MMEAALGNGYALVPGMPVMMMNAEGEFV